MSRYSELPLGKYEKRVIDEGYLAFERLCEAIGSSASEYLGQARNLEAKGADRVPRYRTKWWLITQFYAGVYPTNDAFPLFAAALYGIRHSAQLVRIIGAEFRRQRITRINSNVDEWLAKMELAKVSGDAAWDKLLHGMNTPVSEQA